MLSVVFFKAYFSPQMTPLTVSGDEIIFVLISDVVTFYPCHTWEICKYETRLEYLLTKSLVL